LLVKLY